jgi:hypothetical protein
MTTSHRKHRRTHRRSSSTPEKILSTSLAIVASVGMVVVIGIRTVDANAADEAKPLTAAAASKVPATTGTATASPISPTPPVTPQTGSSQDLAAYAASLAAEKRRLDTYRAKLVQVAKRLHLQAAAQAQGTPAH